MSPDAYATRRRCPGCRCCRRRGGSSVDFRFIYRAAKSYCRPLRYKEVLHCKSLISGNAFLNWLWGTIDKFFRFLETKTRYFPYGLDHLYLHVARTHEDNGKFRLLRRRCRRG